MSGNPAGERWRRALEARRIPEPILDAAPESPWGFPAALFAVRATRAGRTPPAATTSRALEVLPAGGAVLDVGCGGGATSIGLASRAGTITGVDAQEDMLESFRDAIGSAGSQARVVCGPWPDVASEAGEADVVVCGHVVYNVADLGRFVAALDAAATRRVVVELTDRHPLAWMNDLWRSFHGVTFPDGPTAADAVDVMSEMGIRPHREDRPADDATRGGFERRADALALVRRRLCLGPDRDPEIEAALGDRLRTDGGRWSAGPPAGTPVTTLWWDVDR